MKKSGIILLQLVVILIGIGALVFMLWEPLIEGRNAHSTLFEVYFNDPFLAWAYTASIAFFIIIYQAFKSLGYVRQNETFTPANVKALRTIKYSATTIVAFVVAAEAYLFIIRPGDDIAGGVFMGLLMIALFGIISTLAAMFEKLLQNAVDIKSENDLTV